MILPLVELNKLNKEGEEYVPKTRDMSFKYSTRLIVLALAENATLPSWHATLSSPVLPPPPKDEYRTTHSSDAGSATRPQICPSSPQPCLACKPASAFPCPPTPPALSTGCSLLPPPDGDNVTAKTGKLSLGELEVLC